MKTITQDELEDFFESRDGAWVVYENGHSLQPGVWTWPNLLRVLGPGSQFDWTPNEYEATSDMSEAEGSNATGTP